MMGTPNVPLDWTGPMNRQMYKTNGLALSIPEG
jgi:hypothetical protein